MTFRTKRPDGVLVQIAGAKIEEPVNLNFLTEIYATYSELQTRHLRVRHGLSERQARLRAQFAFGERVRRARDFPKPACRRASKSCPGFIKPDTAFCLLVAAMTARAPCFLSQANHVSSCVRYSVPCIGKARPATASGWMACW